MGHSQLIRVQQRRELHHVGLQIVEISGGKILLETSKQLLLEGLHGGRGRRRVQPTERTQLTQPAESGQSGKLSCGRFRSGIRRCTVTAGA